MDPRRSHADQTRACIAAMDSGVVLLLHDATELDYTKKTTVCEQLSQIGQGTHRGYICHNSLAVVADTGAVLGLTSQILHQRADVPKGETLKQSRERYNRESRLWVHGAQASGPAPAGVLCVDVSDSLSDTFEYMAYEVTEGRHFVVRQREDRRLETPVAGHDYLEAAVRALASMGQRQIACWRRLDVAPAKPRSSSPSRRCVWHRRESIMENTPKGRWTCGLCAFGSLTRPQAKNRWSGFC